MDGIEHVGFAHAVQAGEAIEALRKYQGLAFVVFEMGELEGREHVGGKGSVRNSYFSGIRSYLHHVCKIRKLYIFIPLFMMRWMNLKNVYVWSGIGYDLSLLN
jgi:hypothetical protein